jgi:hypothetical protein
MATRPHLKSALDQSARKTEPSNQEDERRPSASPPARSREQTKMISGHFAHEVSRQLKMIAVEEDSTVQALLREALNDLFIKRGKAPIA